MITLTREEAQQVLDVLNDVRYRIEFGQMNLSDDTDAAIETLRARLAQPERKWQGLTDEEMSEAMDYWSDPVRSAYGGAHSADGEYVGMVDTWRYIEAKLKERNT
jgi:hypothetical protein